MLEAWAVGVGGHRSGGIDADGDGFFLGDKLVDFGCGADESGEVDRFEVEAHGAGFGLGDIHEGIEHGEDAVGLFEAVGEGFACRRFTGEIW